MIKESFVNLFKYDRDTTLYRYIEIEKLIYLLLEGALPLSRITNFDDAFESSLPKWIWDQICERSEKAYGRQIILTKEQIDESSNLELIDRKCFFVSCWHANEQESAAMWRLYSNYHKGVAIKTNVKSLIKEFPEWYEHEGQRCYFQLSEVSYVDFSNSKNFFINDITLNNVTGKMHLIKRLSFEYENEIRLWTVTHEGCFKQTGEQIQTIENDYIHAKTNISNIIEEIIVAPGSPDWYQDLVYKIIDKLGYKIKVSSSELSATPYRKFWGFQSHRI